jgi:hypothetical protein
MKKVKEVACKSTNTMGVVGVQEVTFTSFQGTPIQCMHRFMRRIKCILRQVDDLRDVTIYIKALNLSNEMHQWMISIADLLKLPIDFTKTIFIVIRKKHIPLFIGSMS